MSRSRQRLPQDRALVRTFGLTYAKGTLTPPHTAGWHQLLYASRGVMTVRTAHGAWVLPPHRALWLPAGVHVEIAMPGPVALRAIYLAEGWARHLARSPSVVNVGPLLRELILRAVSMGALDRDVPRARRLAQVIKDELATLDVTPMELPMPRDPRALRAASWLLEHPSDAGAIPRLVKKAGASRRTLERIFSSEVAMSFGRWRTRLRVLHAMRTLAEGASVTETALSVGYASVSAFVAMFRREVGTTPSRYHRASAA